jgi:hypothetical protein
MEWLSDFGNWAWARHHNVLSWYIRPLFLLPFVYFAWRRSLPGIALTLVALATSMFWFPAPASPDPGVSAMLAAERDYLTGPWPLWKVAAALSVPVSLSLLAAAFWYRSLWLGLALINAIAIGKIGWSFAFAPTDGAYALVAPALAGLLLCNGAVLYYARFRRF